MKELPKKYNHKEAEKRWQTVWDENKTYKWHNDSARDKTFVIDTPPPTVSGLLHMGHIFSYTQADFVARYQRMKGKDVFYPMGFDDNGLPTERLVEKTKKVRATDMSREDFIELCEGVAEEARGDFRALFKATAMSVDWEQEYHTISDDSRAISQLSFLDLFHKDRAYRKLQPMLWDPADQTAIAQAEVEDKEHKSFAHYIRFGLIDNAALEGAEQGKQAESALSVSETNTPMDEQVGEAGAITTATSWDDLEKVEIMTTRPELLGACVALMCHPDDAAKYEGKSAVTPLFNVVVPIVADEKVDKEKGTGLVMCCTFGDETDIAWWREHELATRVILNKYGKVDKGFNYNDIPCLNIDVANTSFLEIANKKARPSIGNPGGSAREIVIALLKAGSGEQGSEDNNPSQTTAEQTERLRAACKDAFIRSEEITHMEPCAERSGAALEILPTNQWFVKILDQKEQLKAKAAECTWYPPHMKVRVDQWIDGLSWDWCISRQRYFGVPFPIWYSKRAGEEGKVLIADAGQLPVNPLVDLPKGYGREEVVAEADVMDTWATSSVSPQLNSRAINQKYGIDHDRHTALFPADLRPQAHEIIRTWAFYTIVKAHLHEDTIPWKNLMISGWCLASDKTKMSKSKGNVVTPVKLIEEKGTDSVRYWASTSRLGTDTAFSEGVLKIGNKLVNKIWNASKFAAIQLQNIQGSPSTARDDIESGMIYNSLDKWIISRLERAVRVATGEFEIFEYCKAREAIEDFFWNDFCDNYLEMVKARAYDEHGKNPKEQQSAIYAIYHVLDAVLRLFAPFLPHITEELYSHIFDDKFEQAGSIHLRGQWPDAALYVSDVQAEKTGSAARAVLDVVRKLKAEKGVSIKWPLTELAIYAKEDAGKDVLDSAFGDLSSVTNAASVVWAENAGNEETSDGVFTVSVTFAEESDAA